MNPRAQKAGAAQPIPVGLRKLWREAKGWVAWLLTVVDRPSLPTGISREQGAKVSIWLMNIEGAVRRLIIAAALSFQLPAPRTIACACPRTIARKQPATRRPGFCVFRLAASGEASAVIPSQLEHANRPSAPKPYSHVPFPADPLLNLGTPVQHTRIATPPVAPSRTRHPLDRWVRPSRQDPDWRAPDTPSTMFGAPEREPAKPRKQRHTPRPKRTPRDPATLPDSLYDWRRRYDEWQKRVPAPDLAARLDALAHIAANPTAAITSAARRLARSRATTPALARRAIPRTRVPRHATHLYTPNRRIDLPDRCHITIAHADTS